MNDEGFKWSFGPNVELIEVMGSDARIVGAARVSTKGDDVTESVSEGLIGYLMRDRHGSPFEHVIFTWRVTAPIFVWREHHRHRIASYNEESGRYKQLEPHFYIPGPDRNLTQVGKPGAYDFVPGTDEQYDAIVKSTKEQCVRAYQQYEESLTMGIAREVARIILPFNIMSTGYVTMNARALMNFLSLRTKSDESTYKSFPQREIEMVAEKYEASFKSHCPVTHSAFALHGRVAP